MRHALALILAGVMAGCSGSGGGGNEAPPAPKTLDLFVGNATTFGDAEGVGAAARFNNINGLIADNTGNLYVADTGNLKVRKVTAAAAMTTLAGGASPIVSGIDLIYAFDGVGGQAGFRGPRQLAIDAAGSTLAVADMAYTANFNPGLPFGILSASVRRVTIASGSVTIAAWPNFNVANGIAFDGAGNLFSGVASCPSQTVVGLDPPVGCTQRLERLAPGGAITATVWPTDARAGGMATDSTGALYVASPDRHVIVKITSAGSSVFAGSDGAAGSVDGPATVARFNGPIALTIDGANNLYVADAKNFTVRKVTPDGTVTTVAGVPAQAFFATGALPASLMEPRAVEVVGPDLYIAMRNAVAVVRNRP